MNRELMWKSNVNQLSLIKKMMIATDIIIPKKLGAHMKTFNQEDQRARTL